MKQYRFIGLQLLINIFSMWLWESFLRKTIMKIWIPPLIDYAQITNLWFIIFFLSVNILFASIVISRQKKENHKIQNRGRGHSKGISVNIKKKLEKIRESILLTISEHPKSEIIEIAEILSIKPDIAAFHIKELEVSKFVKVAHIQGSNWENIPYREEWSTDQIGQGYLIHHKLI